MVTCDRFVTMSAKSVTVPAGQFKAKCLALLDRVETRGESYIVTKRGRPVARVVPLSQGVSLSLRGSLLEEDDLLSPIAVAWNATR